MTKNLEAAVAFAQAWVVQDWLEDYDLEEAGDVVDSVGVDIAKDTLFVFGEFMQGVVLVKDGVVVNGAIGGFEDNRGLTIEGGYTDGAGREIEFDESGDDAEATYQMIYEQLIVWLEG